MVNSGTNQAKKGISRRERKHDREFKKGRCGETKTALRNFVVRLHN
jgi:hypothetical protein